MSINSLSPEDWFKKFKEGDKEAFAQMVHSFELSLILLADALQPDEPRSEKIVYRSFTKAFNRRRTFESKDDLLAYLRKIIIKACTPRRYFRRPKKIAAREKKDFPEFFQNESYAENPFILLIKNGIRQMGPMPLITRRIFELFYEEARSESEIAAELGLTRQEVMTKMNRFLRIFLQDPEADPFLQ
ncbi:MAG TPA: hypothetical protein VF939_25790 [Puia sp.]